MALKRATEIPTIDVEMVVITVGEQSYAIDTASVVGVEVVTQTVEATQLIVKGKLKAQKKAQTVITGNTLTITDNVFTPEIVQILQGGTITYDEEDDTKITGYRPPVVGSEDRGETFVTSLYSAQYDTAGNIVQYEKVDYPNCTGNPVSLNSEDGVFRAPEYTINSAPARGESPYTIEYVAELPAVV